MSWFSVSRMYLIRVGILLQVLRPSIVNCEQYDLLNSYEVYDMMMDFQDNYPDLVRVENAQARYGLTRAGNSNDCVYEFFVTGCSNYFFTIQDYIRFPEGSDGDLALPTVLLSGAVHGDERVGPTAVIETSALMLYATQCEASSDDACKISLWEEYGINTSQRQWLARLVATRRIIVVPAANALGFDRNQRREGGIDPNRDFAYDNQPGQCMRSIAARTLNEIFREHFIQLSLTFHGGTEMLGFEWGNPGHYPDFSPDDRAQRNLAEAFAEYGDGWSGHPTYLNDMMNDIIYYVNGGMEDWAYAASWDSPLMLTCQPSQHGGYPTEKTTYSPGMFRTFNMLVETSYRKSPFNYDLGDDFDVLDPKNNDNGHIPRNIRLSISTIDLVQPYASFLKVNDVMIEKDIKPLQDSKCSIQSPIITQKYNKLEEGEVLLRWTVGGALNIDKTELRIAKYRKRKHAKNLFNKLKQCKQQPFEEVVINKFSLVSGSTQSGTGYFKEPEPTITEGSDGFDKVLTTVVGPVFSASLNITSFMDESDFTRNKVKFMLLASVEADSNWKNLPEGDVSPSRTGPQAHVVHARTNKDWYYENPENGRFIQGRKVFYSLPLRLTIKM